MVYQMNCLGFTSFYEKGLSFNDLLLFALVSVVIVSSLLFYYNKISNKNISSSKKVAIPIYNSKDNFSQEIIGDSNFILVEKSTSIFTKITVYLLSFLIATTSIYKLITNGLIEFIG